MSDELPFKVGDLIRYKKWVTGSYKVVAITGEGSLFVQTTDKRPFTRIIEPTDFDQYEKVPHEQPNEPNV